MATPIPEIPVAAEYVCHGFSEVMLEGPLAAIDFVVMTKEHHEAIVRMAMRADSLAMLRDVLLQAPLGAAPPSASAKPQ